MVRNNAVRNEELSKGVQAALAKDQAAQTHKDVQGENAEQRIHLLADAAQAQIKTLLKEDKVTVKLNTEDLAFCSKSMSDTYDEVYRQGGYMDLKGQLEASANRLSSIQFNLCLRAEIAHEGTTVRQVAVRVVYMDRLFQQLEEQAQFHERKERMKAGGGDERGDKVLPIEELLGKYWVQQKSRLRRSMIAGLLPTQFKNAAAFVAASKPARKPRGATTAGEAGGKTDSGNSFATLAREAGYGDLTAAALGKLVTQLRKVDPEATDINVAQILTAATQQIMALASGSEGNDGKDFDKGVDALDKQAEQDADAGEKAAAAANKPRANRNRKTGTK